VTDEMTPERLREIESEAERACLLVVEVLSGRTTGNRDSVLGNSDDDLLFAIEDAEENLAALKATLHD
jgi:hypothetical protein